MTPRDLAHAFVEKGLEDETVLAKVLHDTEVSDAIIGFHAQQAVEKYLKAVLAIEQERPIKTHDLGVLLGQCEGTGHRAPITEPELAPLTGFAVDERYPLRPVPSIDREWALRMVRTVRGWTESLLSEGA